MKCWRRAVKRKVRFEGRIDAVGDAALADHNAEVACTKCPHKQMMYAYRLANTKVRGPEIPLGVPNPWFYCRWCKRPVEAIVRSTGPFAG